MSAALDTAAWPAPSVRVEPVSLAGGEHGHIVVTIDVPDGCHIQSHTPREPFLIPTTLHLDHADGVVVGEPVYPDGKVDRFEWTPLELEVYRGRVEIVVPVAVADAAGVGNGTVVLSGSVRYQGCTESACLPPVEVAMRAQLVITA